MDFRHRALYYMTDTGSGSPVDTADKLLSQGLKADYFKEYDKARGSWADTPEYHLFKLCLEFLNGPAHARIPIDTLLAKAEKIGDAEIREFAIAVTRNLRGQTGEGADIPEICTAIRESYRKCLLHSTLVDVHQNVLKPQLDPAQADKRLYAYLEEIESMGAGGDEMVYDFGSTASDHLIDYQKRVDDPEAGLGIPTGLLPFDSLNGGIKRGEVAVLYGRTKGGKTCLCGNIAANAYLLGHSVGCACKEMYGEVIRRRVESGLLLAEVNNGLINRRPSGIDGGLVRALERGELPDEYKARFTELQLQFQEETEKDHRFWMFEPGSYDSLKELKNIVGYTKRRYGLDLLWVDSMNIQNTGGRVGDRHDLVQGDVAMILRDIAISNHIAILVDAQEKPATWNNRYATIAEISMFSNSIGQRVDHAFRMWVPPDKPHLREFQHLLVRSGTLVKSFPLHFFEQDTCFSQAPDNAISEEVERFTGPAPMPGAKDDDL